MVRWSRMRRATPEEWEVRLVAQIHDELLFEVPERIVDHQAEQLAAIMTGVFPNLKVPILVNVSSGSTWGSLQKIKIKCGLHQKPAVREESRSIRGWGSSQAILDENLTRLPSPKTAV